MTTKREAEIVTSHLQDYMDAVDSRAIAARDYGSRATGLSDPSSDYDVFFLFVQPPAEYAIGAATDTYTTEIPADETDLDAEIELHGWNLRKFVGNDGIGGSNPTAVEFCQSDETYYWIDGVAGDRLSSLVEHTLAQFKPYALLNHERSKAANNYGKYIETGYELVDSEIPSKYQGNSDMRATISEPDEHRDGYQLNLGRAGSIGIEEALDRGWVRETTTDRTVKRYLNVIQALLRARYVEDTHDPPPMDCNELCRWAAGADWIDERVYARIGDLIADKTDGRGDMVVDPPAINSWIESELARDVAPEPHVQRNTDTETIRTHARALYDAVHWKHD